MSKLFSFLKGLSVLHQTIAMALTLFSIVSFMVVLFLILSASDRKEEAEEVIEELIENKTGIDLNALIEQRKKKESNGKTTSHNN